MKERNKETIIEPEKTEIYKELDLIKFTAEVQGRIKQHLTSDFVLAKLEEKDKTYIIEMTSTAYLTQRIYQKLIFSEMTRQLNLNETEDERKENIEKIKEQAKITFDIYLNELSTIAILNRNVENNPILKILGRINQEMEQEEAPEVKGFLKKIGEKLKNDKKTEV